MVNNVAKKEFTIDIQTREGLEHLKNRYITDTGDIKEELRADREVKKILDQERIKIYDIQREVDTMRMDMVKTDCPEFWSQEMEGDITPVLYILDEHMKKNRDRGRS